MSVFMLQSVRHLLCGLALATAALAGTARQSDAAEFCGQDVFLNVNVLFAGFPAPPELGFGGDVTCSTSVSELEFNISLVDDDTISLEFMGSLQSILGDAGFVFSDTADLISPFKSLSVTAPNFVGLTGADAVIESGNEFRLRFQGVTEILAEDGGLPTILLDVEFGGNGGVGVVPLPATLPLALGGIGLLVAAGRRRKVRSAM